MIIALIISQLITLGMLWYLYRKVVEWNKAQESYINEVVEDLETDFILPGRAKLKTVKEKPIKKLEHFIPSKDLDYIMSGKQIDPFD